MIAFFVAGTNTKYRIRNDEHFALETFNVGNNSDYTKSRMNLFEYLPEVFQSDVNRSLAGNLFNRFLTKQESTPVLGYIGQRSNTSTADKRLQESSVHRQAYQLQPAVYNKVGTVEQISSWYDILNKIKRYGVSEQFDDWLSVTQFNWAPPIDIDKLVNYHNYYWYDEEHPNSQPQYITIRSRCNRARTYAKFQQRLVDKYGETIPIMGYGEINGGFPEYNIKTLAASTGQLTIDGDASDVAQLHQTILLVNDTHGGVYHIITPPVYDESDNTTTFNIDLLGESGEITTGIIKIQIYDKLIVRGDFTKLFEPRFSFFVKDSSNLDLNSNYWNVVNSVFDQTNNITVITINTRFSNNVVSGSISLTENLATAIDAQMCQCQGTTGWDYNNWDDNPSNPLWNLNWAPTNTPESYPPTVGGNSYIDYNDPSNTRQDKINTRGFVDHQAFLESISNTSDPQPSDTYVDGQLWWNTTSDVLHQYTSTSGWKPVITNFLNVAGSATGSVSWDFVSGCGQSSIVPAADAWISQNKWRYKDDIPNFSIAKQAKMPILEYEWDLELNEWTNVTHRWKYRSDASAQWVDVNIHRPELIELVQIGFFDNVDLPGILPGRTIRLDERYGDLTPYFTPGRKFTLTGLPHVFEVEKSVYFSATESDVELTHIILTEAIDPVSLDITFGSIGTQFTAPVETTKTSSSRSMYIQPTQTTMGDPWRGYNTHWVYVGQRSTVPVAHIPMQQFVTVNSGVLRTPHPTGEYEYAVNYYAQDSVILKAKSDTFGGVSVIELSSELLNNTNRPLTNRALLGANDVRVYVNQVRQYGTFVELSGNDLINLGYSATADDVFVAGIQFISGYELEKSDIVHIEVGEASIIDIGWATVPVRVQEDDSQYLLEGNSLVSLVQFKKEEQVKTSTTQYPLFDIYNVDGTPAYQANFIFGFHTDSSAQINNMLGQRLATKADAKDYVFKQTLIQNGQLYAYRDYANVVDIWVNTATEQVWFWDGITWTSKKKIGGFLTSAHIGVFPPSAPLANLDGMYWYDTQHIKLKQYHVGASAWFDVSSVTYSSTDPTLQTIWKKGLHDEQYTIQKRDWDRRTQTEYDVEKQNFIRTKAYEYQATGLDIQDATVRAENDWTLAQSNKFSSDGSWVGDWEIPDPLFYNNAHENRDQISYRELLSHFNSIISSQPKYPGFEGASKDAFHLIPINEVNYGVGGKIKEYNDGFDIFISSIINDVVSPRTLYKFARDQYATLLNGIQDAFRQSVTSYLKDTSGEVIVNLAKHIADDIISTHEQNTSLNLIYGDSTTFSNGVGIRNWIATLAFIKLLHKCNPYIIADDMRGISQIVHHDGHRGDYSIPTIVEAGIIKSVLQTKDPRALTNTLGKSSTNLPPNTVDQFQSEFGTTIDNRAGVYWLTKTSTHQTLFRLNVAAIGTVEPPPSLPDGSLWLDLTPMQEGVRIKTTNELQQVEWKIIDNITPGTHPIRLHNGTDVNDITTATISAWAKINISELLSTVILEIEQRLYQAAPTVSNLVYDYDTLRAKFPAQFNRLIKEAFHAYLSTKNIHAPFSNVAYDASDPFTWNYKYSIPGQWYNIVDVNPTISTFSVSGNRTSLFSHTATIIVRNSGMNDGVWRVLGSSYNAQLKVTNIVVDSQHRRLDDDVAGTVVVGVFPSLINPYDQNTAYNKNTGVESGGDWRDLYQKVYGTPFPHREPWVLQGYASKPIWWDIEYKNNDPVKWGDREWKYKHGCEIVGANVAGDWFEITGDFRANFLPNTTFTIANSEYHNGTWHISSPTPIANVVAGNAGSSYLEIAGNVASNVQVNSGIFVFNSNIGSQAGWSLTVSRVQYISTLNKTVVYVNEAIPATTSIDMMSRCFYNFNTNVTRIYVTTPVTTSIIDGVIAKPIGMWDNIKRGIIPPGREYPNGVVSITGAPETELSVLSAPLPKWAYFSVNIHNQSIGGYAPDSILPPYWDHTSVVDDSTLEMNTSIRTLYTSYSNIITPNVDYTYNDMGPVEWEWRNSLEYQYDLLDVAFRLDPVRFLSSTFGTEYYNIGGVSVDVKTRNVFSHKDVRFHGELVGSEVLQVAGTNQWYVNYLRYYGLDAGTSEFKPQWKDWTVPLIYQFDSFIDTMSFNLAHNQICTSQFDYAITTKKSVGVEDYWLDAIFATFINVPPKILRYDNDLAWEIELSNKSTVGKSILYYDVHNYQFHVNLTSNTCTIYTWDIVVETKDNAQVITIDGDHTSLLHEGMTCTIGDDNVGVGTFTIQSSIYDVISHSTIVNVQEPILNNLTGTLSLNYRTLPWNTGDNVILSTTETLPAPLIGDTVNGVHEYFIIKIDDRTFRLARTRQQAQRGEYIPLTSVGRGSQFVGQLSTTFTTSDKSKIWKHYSIDRANVLMFTPPNSIKGLQTAINIIDGYEAYSYDQGWRINADNTLRDFSDTSRHVCWQREQERMIEFAYKLQTTKFSVRDRFQVTLNATTNTLTFTSSIPKYITGNMVNIFPITGTYPAPLAPGMLLYVIRDSATTCRLAATYSDAKRGIAIEFSDDTTGVGELAITEAANLRKQRPTFEINPFREGIWFRPTVGVVSNLLHQANNDIYTAQALLDQYGRPIGRNHIRVFREDKQTTLRIREELANDVELTTIFNDPYNYIHLASIHLFIDTYEHILKFNNRTTEGGLLYDPFLGLNVTKFAISFNRQHEQTRRPNVGGHYFITDHNQSSELRRNIEASITDLRYLYDTHLANEYTTLTKYGRTSIGYTGTQGYLDKLNINAKSQFIFWKGQIQTKGSMTSVQAFVNSKRFIDAKVDEFWAVRLAEFGANKEKEYLDMWLHAQDARSNGLKIEFMSDENICYPGYATNVYSSNCLYSYPNSGDPTYISDVGFLPISMVDTNRWYNQPDQNDVLRNNGGQMYIDLKPTTKITIYIGQEPDHATLNAKDGWVSVSDSGYTLKKWRTNVPTAGSPQRQFGGWDVQHHGTWDIGDAPMIRHETCSDHLSITLDWYPAGHKWCSRGSPVGDCRTASGIEVEIDPYIFNAGSIIVFKDGVQQNIGIDYSEVASTNTELLSDKIRFSTDVDGSVIEVVYKTSTLVEGIHFDRLTSNIVKFIQINPSVFDTPTAKLHIWGWLVDRDSQTPAKIIDKKANVVITPVEFWDPARGYHYSKAIHVVDIQNANDPATYHDQQRLQLTDSSTVYPESWNSTEVGRTWLDTSNIGYVPYYDPLILTNVDDRMRLWGAQADWSNMQIYTWVESDVRPDEFDAISSVEEGETTIPSHIRKSGRVRYVLYEKMADTDQWVELTNKYDHFDVYIDGSGMEGTSTFQLINTLKQIDDTSQYYSVDIYKNGKLLAENVSPSSEGTITVDNLWLTDQITIMLPIPTDPNVISEQISLGRLKREVPTNTVNTYDMLGRPIVKYYFWVSDSLKKRQSAMSPREAKIQLSNIPTPYVFCQKVFNSTSIVVDGISQVLPVRYVQVIIRGLRGIINDDFRYIIRWNRDFSLRDSLSAGTTQLELKNVHVQWELIRPEQQTLIPRRLWDKITECMIGYKLNSPSVHVPSLERTLYDAEHGTATRFGLSDGQALSDGQLAIKTILADLQDPKHDFSPIDIDEFFYQHSFDTPDNILAAMDIIYDTFLYIHVNRMFFSVLADGLSLTTTYNGIFKTSMIALHGIKPLQEQDEFL